MKKATIFLFAILISSYSLAAELHTFKVLVFSKTAGFRHSSIDEGIAAIQQLGLDNDFEVDATEDASAFTFANLIQYDAVIFLSTTGDILDADQQTAFEQYIQSGGGFVGIHAASDTEYDWPWYGELVGAYFASHPPGTTEATIEVADKNHPSTEGLPDYWVRTDEWYNFQDNPRGDVHVLATLDEGTFSGGTMGYDHPIAWMHDYDGGRAWYTAGGHTEESYSEALFLEHILGGILYASGDVSGSFDASSEDKYQVTVVDNNPVNPMALAVLPNLDVLYIERGGTLKLRDIETGIISEVGQLSVDSGREDGLIGIVLDPDFETNSWVYLFYSPSAVVEQRVSRFEFVDDELDLSTEEIILQIPVQRDQCCHSGGDMEFDHNGNLFITTGDNVNPFASDGYTPIDEQSGRSAWDAQGTSANTNDLRGKILRIHPEDDGTYTIPDGNLFANAEDGLPEIYVMGTRNPFRIAVNKATSELVWGDVGPDAGGDSGTRGPRGYDEFNRTSTAGNFGWPYCIADNQAYIDYDFATSTSGSAFDCSNPVNNSPNNTGSTTLPVAQPAWLYYPYGDSDEWPELGSENARTAIGGAYYFYDSTNVETGSFPQYYDSTLFILEWTRNWIKEVRFDEDGNLLQINSFLDGLTLNRPIDMDFGPDGAMYIIEWGTGFGGGNDDARIIKIQYVENLANRAPFAIASASVTSGPAPLEVNFNGSLSTDPDNDDLNYSWDFDEDDIEDSGETNPTFTYTENGSYVAKLTVTDPDGEFAVAQVNIIVGNSAPTVTISEPINGGFYEDGDIIEYTISVTDPEEGSTEDGIDCNDVVVEPSIGHDDHAHGVGATTGCTGSFLTEPHGDGPDNVFYVLNAEYTDNGGDVGASLTGNATIILNQKKKQAQHSLEFSDLQTESTGDFLGGGLNVGFVNDGSYLRFGAMNFEGIEYFTARYATQQNPAQIEVRLDSPTGELIASTQTSITGGWQTYDYFTSSLDAPEGTHENVYIVFSNPGQFGIGNLNFFEFFGIGAAKENPDSLKGLAATYYPSTDFTGTPVKRQEPMIAWNWEGDSPAEGIPADGFSARWEGQIVAPSSGQYSIIADDGGGDVEVWIDGERRIFGFISSYTTDLVEGEPIDIVVEYTHESGDASMYLRWSGSNPSNVIHSDYLIPDLEALQVSNELETEKPGNFQLSQNYPNPFNPSTNIQFSIPNAGKVSLDIFNLLGQTVQVLVDEVRNEGTHSVTFDASALSSGVYFYQLEFDGKVLSKRMILLK
ncbi:MAG: carbohydrate-binding protein [Balneola sp.]|nr:MAG: carbohydrate-binding protein [Balneola sp.]